MPVAGISRMGVVVSPSIQSVIRKWLQSLDKLLDRGA